MANYPDNPNIGDVYNVDGVSMLCVGTKRFSYIPETQVFPTVAEMKLGIIPANHRATARRYSNTGKLVENLTYVSRGAGWPVVADGMVNHADTKGNYLELQLVNNTISLDHTGADATGVVDAAPHLRAAMARLLANNGGVLHIPVGTFYLTSGDPRGLKIAGTADFYTVCEIVNNVTVRGEGDNSILKYNSNRIGVVPATGKGDVGALFANFRVRTVSTTPYACANFHIQSCKVVFTTLSNQLVDFIDGQVVRVFSLNGSVNNGVFSATDVNVSNLTGHQAFSYEKVDAFKSSGCRFYGSGKLTNLSNTDVSLYYVTGTQAEIKNNYSEGSTASSDNSTFIELHTLYCTVTDNFCVGMNTFMNAVSQVTHPSSFYDFSVFHVNNNHARGVRNFIVDWVAPSNRKSLLEISDNTMVLRAEATTDVEGIVKHAIVTGASDLPTELLVLNNNIVVTAISGNGVNPVDYGTSFDAMIRHQFVKEIQMSGGEFKNTRRALLAVDGTNIQKVHIEGVKADFGLCGNGTEDASALASRSGIVINFGLGTALQRVTLKHNNLSGKYTGGATNHGVYTLTSGGTIYPVVDIEDNNIYATNGEDLGSVVFGGSTHGADTISIRHRTKKVTLPAVLAGMFPNIGVSAITAGSTVSLGSYTVEVTPVGSGKEFVVYGKASAQPTSGYFSTGSFIQNTAAGVFGWKCDASGTPGTWSARA